MWCATVDTTGCHYLPLFAFHHCDALCVVVLQLVPIKEIFARLTSAFHTLIRYID